MRDLEMLLREVRPAPDPAWATRLDARVAARFPVPPPRWKAPLIALRQHFFAFGALATVASLLVVVVITGLPELGGDDDADSGSVAEMAAPASGGTEESADSGASTAAPERRLATPQATVSPSLAAPLQDADRAVLHQATLTLSTSPDKVEAVTDRAIAAVDAMGGFVQTSAINRAGNNASATLTVRIPAARLESGLAQLSKLAHVKERSQQAEDLTDQREALEASVRDARADRAGLRARLAKATTDAERSKLRAQLDRATRRVTQRQRRVAELESAVSFATVELAVEGDRQSTVAPPGGRWTPGDALGDALRVLEVAVGVLMVGLAALLPLALIGALAAVAARLLVRRRRERALEMA